MSTFKDYDGRTALHVAASEGRLALVEHLIAAGAQVNVSDRWGGSPLDDGLHPNVEERLLQLEGDKDSLHLQVRIHNSDISIDILSGCGLIIGRIVFLGRRATWRASQLTRQKKDRNLKGRREGGKRRFHSRPLARIARQRAVNKL